MQQGVLAGRYRLERQLGKGGMGSVWLAEHLSLRSWVAVKLMDPAIAATPEGAERFRREAQAAASLRSAHVVQVLDYGLHETTPFLVMELLQGESLAGCLEREKRLSPERTLAVMTQVCRALGRAHAAGIVHRDLKPDNVFLVREDDQELVKVLDFGIAKTPQAQFGGMETRTGVTMGTPYYMSPEQVEGRRAVDFRTDLWAMAVITCECLTGARPFDGSTFGELLLNICARPIPPPSSQGLHLAGFDAWFAKATSRDPEQRFASAQELSSTLREVVAGTFVARAATLAAPLLGGVAATQAYAGPTPHTGTAYAAASSGPYPVTAHPPSTASLNTAQSLEVARRSSAKGALPWILLAVVTLLGGGALALLLLRSAHPDASAASAASALSAVTPPALGAQPASATTTPGAAPTESLAPKPAPAPIAAAPAKPPKSAEPSAATQQPSPAHHEPTSPAPSPPPASALAAPVKTQRCFSDPFSGQIRPVTAGQPSGAASFGCKQDPFTGKYKKL